MWNLILVENKNMGLSRIKDSRPWTTIRVKDIHSRMEIQGW